MHQEREIRRSGGYAPRRFVSFTQKFTKEKNRARCSQNNRSNHNNRLITVATCVMAAASVCSFFTALITYFVLDGQLNEMRESGGLTKRAVAASEKLASSAQGQVNVSSDTARTQLRAYVSARPFLPRPISGTRANLHAFNVGHTPARSVRHRGQLDIFPYPLPNDFSFPALSGSYDLTDLTLFPGLPIETYALAARDFQKQEWVEAESGQRARFYVWGEIEYLDVFRVPRRTLYCISYSGTGEQKSWAYCDRHNDAH